MGFFIWFCLGCSFSIVLFVGTLQINDIGSRLGFLGIFWMQEFFFKANTVVPVASLHFISIPNPL